MITETPLLRRSLVSFALAGLTLAAGAQNAQPLEFTQNFDELSPNQLLESDQWTLDDALWATHSAGGIVAVGPMRPTGAAAKANTRPFSSGHLRASVAVSERAGAGLFFGRAADGSEFLVRLAASSSPRDYAGQLELTSYDGENYTVLDAAEIYAPAWEWALLDVTVVGSTCNVSLNTEPLLTARLPRSAEGTAGLYVDGTDALFGPHNYIGNRAVENAAEVRLDEFVVGPGARAEGLLGLALRLAEDQAILARWSEIAPDGESAGRIEIVWTSDAGEAEVLASADGPFPIAELGTFRVAWSAGKLAAYVADEVVCEADSPPLTGDVGALAVRRPVSLFGALSIHSLELAIVPRAAGDPRPVPAPPGAAESTESLFSTPLYQTPAAASMVSIPVRFDTPFGLELPLRPNSEQVLWFEPREDGDIDVRILGVPESPATVLPRAAVAGEQAAIQLIHRGMRVQAFAGGEPVSSALRYVRGPFAVGFRAPESQPAPAQLLSLNVGGPQAAERVFGRWFNLGYSFPGVAPDPWVDGDISFAAQIRLDSTGEKNLLSIHEAADAPGSGYTLEIVSGNAPTWAVYKRGGKPLVSNAIPPGLAPLQTFALQLDGPFLSVFAGPNLLFSAWDPSPLRGGFARWNREGRFMAEEEAAVLSRHWDVPAIFHRRANISAALALWEVAEGSWVVREIEDGTTAYAGTTDGNGVAALEYRGPLETEDVLIELQISPPSLGENEHLIIDLLVAGGAHPVERVVFSRPADGITKLLGMRNTRSIEESVVHDLGRVVSVRRSAAELEVLIDHVPYATLNAPSGAVVHGVKIGLAGRPNSGIALHTVAVSRNPRDARKVPGPLRQVLDALHSERP